MLHKVENNRKETLTGIQLGQESSSGSNAVLCTSSGGRVSLVKKVEIQRRQRGLLRRWWGRLPQKGTHLSTSGSASPKCFDGSDSCLLLRDIPLHSPVPNVLHSGVGNQQETKRDAVCGGGRPSEQSDMICSGTRGQKDAHCAGFSRGDAPCLYTSWSGDVCRTTRIRPY